MRVTRAAFRYRRNYALAVAAERAAPALRAASRVLSRGPSTDPTSWRRGLIIGHSHVGDVLYRTCSLEQLKAGLPDCSWDYLTSRSSEPILRDNPALNAVLPFTLGDDSSYVAAGSFEDLWQAQYDVVICTNTVRHLDDFVRAVMLGIPNRVGFGDKGYSGLLTLPVATAYPQPLAGYFRTLVGAVIGKKPDWPLQPRVYPSESDWERADACLGGLRLDPSLPTIACAATTRQLVGAWSTAFFGDVLSRFLRERAANVVLFGAALDAPILHDIATSLPSPVHVVAGELAWLEFAEVLRRCDVLLTMDSGPRHLANAVGTPVAFARNLSFARVEAGAYCANEVDLAPAEAEGTIDRDIQLLVRSTSFVERAVEVLLELVSRSRG
ncbi:MAG: glycosyltransferase family 9 protein [bacterium]